MKVADGTEHDNTHSGNNAPSVKTSPASVSAGGGDGSDDPFDPRHLRISQDFATSAPVKRIITAIPTEKPAKQTFFRAHPNRDYHLLTQVLEVRDAQRELYLVAPNLRDALAMDATTKYLVTIITRENNVRIWPINYTDASGRSNRWNESALEAVRRAEKRWVRVVANMDIGAYDIFEAVADLPDPQWPELSFAELLKTAFKDRYITSLDHPILRRIRGEV